ncbi:MAG: hypothetical protein HQL45_17720 [Alphaproteobacteria bacterium]|nr:hypothetical protein [Alphaproteobacteria bacterium]
MRPVFIDLEASSLNKGFADVELAYDVFRKQEHQSPGERKAAMKDASQQYIAAEQLACNLAPITHSALADALHHAVFYLLLRPGGDRPDAVETMKREIEKVMVFATSAKEDSTLPATCR